MQRRDPTLKPGIIWKEPSRGGGYRLYNEMNMEWIVKNSLSAGKPRFVTIAGNDIMRTFHEHTRVKIVDTLVSFFKEGIDRNLRLEALSRMFPPPYKLSLEVHTFPRRMNWDLDNLWIYNKCFQDALIEAKVIPDDNIRYIPRAASPEFVPISKEGDRKMIFTLEEDRDPRRLQHLMYWSMRNGPMGMWKSEVQEAYSFDLIKIVRMHTGKPGDVIVDTSSYQFPTILINIGARGVTKPDNIDKALRRVAYQCFQLNVIPDMEAALYFPIEENIERILYKEAGIPVMFRPE